jgi:chromosome segregation ATPase
MFKKIAIAAFAIGVGVLILSRVSLVRVLWNDGKSWVARQVPPEVQLKEIKSEVEKIDGEIKKNLSKLAKKEVEAQNLDEEVAHLTDLERKLRADMRAMDKSLDAGTTKVNFEGRDVRVTDLTRRLDMATTRYKSVVEQLKTKKALLGDKRKTLEAAHNRITAMRNQQEELRMEVSRLETQIEVLKQKQVDSRIEVDDSQVSHCRQRINALKTQLREGEEETRLLVKYGYQQPVTDPADGAKTPDEVRKAARAALSEDDGAVVDGK